MYSKIQIFLKSYSAVSWRFFFDSLWCLLKQIKSYNNSTNSSLSAPLFSRDIFVCDFAKQNLLTTWHAVGHDSNVFHHAAHTPRYFTYTKVTLQVILRICRRQYLLILRRRAHMSKLHLGTLWIRTQWLLPLWNILKSLYGYRRQ